jgi:cobalt-precorrin-5B (C1)-methyltransferase
MGTFTGSALGACVRHGISWVAIAGMVGKVSKLAQGILQTHMAGGKVDGAFLAEVAAAGGAGSRAQEELRDANTARRAGEIAERGGFAEPFYSLLASLARDRCTAHAKGRLEVVVVLFDFSGRVLARASA